MTKKNTAEDFLKHVKIQDEPAMVAVDQDGNLIPLEDVPLDLLPEEDLGVATGEDYNK